MRRISIKDYETLSKTDTNRFYPQDFPVVDFEPLKTHFQLLSSPEDIGKAIITLVSFQKEDLVAKCLGVTLPYQTLHSLQYKKGMYFHDDWFAGFLLHSCDPNCMLDMETFSLIALRDIKAFELLTIDYEKTEEELHQGFNLTPKKSLT